MARGPFPTLDLQPTLSPDVYTPPRSDEAAAAFGQIAHAADQFGSTLQDMAETAAKQEGATQAAKDVTAGVPKPTGGTSLYAQSYDQVANRFVASQQKAAMSETLNQAFLDNSDNPAAFAKAAEAARAGMKSSGVPEIDAEVAGNWAILRSDYMARAQEGAKKKLDGQATANFLTDLDTGQQTLDQAAAGATFDQGGAQRVAQATQGYIQGLARYGPKEAFSAAGFDFPADPTRQATISPEKMTEALQKGIRQARETWILSTAEALPSADARRAFGQQVEQRWKAGDPALAGLDGADMQRVQRQLEASADRQHAVDRQGQVEAADRAKNAIAAFTWGGDVDFNQVVADAKASGDVGLMAQAQFYAQADPETRGVLRSVVARQLGLMGQTGPGEQLVDATGQPVARGARNNNPGNVKALPAGQKWQGQVGVDGDGYAVFATPQAGAEAAKSNLRSYGRKGLDTVQSIVSTWAPAADHNNPQAYAATVAAKLHVAPTDKLNLNDPAVVDHLAAAMFDVEMPGTGTWATPATVKPGTPAYLAWASTREGFTTDPLTYARGGANRPAIAQVPVLVPQGAFSNDPATSQAWAQSFAKRWSLGQTLSQSYGVPARTLTNGERDFYKAQIEGSPMQGIALAASAANAAGPDAAMHMLRELGESDFEASANLHIADLYAGGARDFATKAVQGLQLKTEGKAKLGDPDLKALDASFATLRGVIPSAVLGPARATAEAAMISEQVAGGGHPIDWYVHSAIGASTWNGRMYGGVGDVGGQPALLPRWLRTDRAGEAFQALGDLWHSRGNGPAWANGVLASGHELARTQPTLQPNGRYRFVNPRTGNPLVTHDGRPFEVDLDQTRGYLASVLGPDAVMGAR